MGTIEIFFRTKQGLRVKERLLGVTRVGFDLYLWYHIKNNGPGTWLKKKQHEKKNHIFQTAYSN